jgi:hypothetical protein
MIKIHTYLGTQGAFPSLLFLTTYLFSLFDISRFFGVCYETTYYQRDQFNELDTRYFPRVACALDQSELSFHAIQTSLFTSLATLETAQPSPAQFS